MFSFNSPQGMCPECVGLGHIYTFDPDKLIPDPSRSFQQGCVDLVGKWREMGRWRRHIFRGVAEALERKYDLAHGSVLESAWEELDPAVQNGLLWGVGDDHITFTWRSGPSGYKWGGKFEGIIPKLLEQYRTTKSRMQRRQLEKYMRILDCGSCNGQRLNPQARSVTLTSRSPLFHDSPQRTLPEVCALPITEAEEFFVELELDATGQGHRRRGDKRNPRPAEISQKRGPGLSNPRTHSANAFWRRNATHPTGRPNRLRAGGAFFTFSMNHQSACIRATTTACCTRLPASVIKAIQWSLSSTTKTQCVLPTT